jgi:hypothetical protein
MHPSEILHWDRDTDHCMYWMRAIMKYWAGEGDHSLLHQRVTFLYDYVACFLQRAWLQLTTARAALRAQYDSVMQGNLFLRRLEQQQGLPRAIRWKILPPGLGSQGRPTGQRS